MFTQHRFENHVSHFSSRAITVALVALLVAGCAAPGFAEQPQPEAFAIVGSGAGSGPAYAKAPDPETKTPPAQIQQKSPGQPQQAAPEANNPSKADRMRCVEAYACQPGRNLFRDKWDRRFGAVNVFDTN